MTKGLLGRLNENPVHDRPLAAAGLTSYRLHGRYGWIMIGATDHEDAMREAARSTQDPRREALEVWDGERYVRAFPFDPALVSIARHRQSVTQGEVSVSYGGRLLGRYGDHIQDAGLGYPGEGAEVVGGWFGMSDEHWRNVARAVLEREAA